MSRSTAVERERRRSPPLDRDEWLLLLDLFLSSGRQVLPDTDDRLVRLGAEMRRRRPDLQSDWRQPHGLRREMVTFRILDAGAARPVRKIAALAEEVWEAHVQELAPGDSTVAAERSDALPDDFRNPDWTYEETLLGLDAYLRLRPKFAAARDPVVIDLSQVLLAYAQSRGVTGGASFRNPEGVARKINKFRAPEAGLDPKSVRGGQLEGVLWRAYLNDPGGLVLAAASLRDVIAAGASLQVQVIGPHEPTRGPVPSYGQQVSLREDGLAWVYIMQLTGPVSALYPDTLAQGYVVIKVGRTNDVGRRATELNRGFPPRSGLAWRPVDRREYSSGLAAHSAERELLTKLHAAGLTLGGEFAISPRSAVPTWLWDQDQSL